MYVQYLSVGHTDDNVKVGIIKHRDDLNEITILQKQLSYTTKKFHDSTQPLQSKLKVKKSINILY